jgi:hypothetical protein
MLFKILPLLWIAFILAVVLLPTIASLMGRPKGLAKPKTPKAKKGKKNKGEPQQEESLDDVPPEPSLDFGDELAQAGSAKG